MRDTIRRVALGLYVCWLVAVVLLVAGRHTPLPSLPGVHESVVLGAGVLTLVGAVSLLRDGYRWLAG
ncbi:hypothetical protein C453_04114 [Haloferax elongans ATCC BAA-1513]|uniref:Uncharacterized protein n=1 Tax=Haloferax elongans ATCC BAA-1513 TaxID=1230453 RepID=M0HV24_HALEO|nr:hypothetical protein [Haloferax elongans]ELZ87507.1 hypothetical protein C453_04114 [Haloferax elongans ATCC BAA-1513]